MKLGGKIAIVTGGGRGIGKGIALAFAREGADLILVSRTMPEIEKTAAEVRELGRRGLPVEADVSNKIDVTNMVNRAIEQFGVVDILVNNAGIQGPIGPMTESDVNSWIRTVNTNLIGSYLCTRAVLPIMIRRRKGKIINLSGGGSTYPRPYFTAYSASKAAVVRLTESLAEEVKDFNIQVNAIAPGAVNTRMLAQVLGAGEAAGKKASAEAKRIKERGGTPLELPARLAVFLASSESNALTGRLISAVHDNWHRIPEQIPQIMSSDIYTMRRINPRRNDSENESWKDRR